MLASGHSQRRHRYLAIEGGGLLVAKARRSSAKWCLWTLGVLGLTIFATVVSTRSAPLSRVSRAGELHIRRRTARMFEEGKRDISQPLALRCRAHMPKGCVALPVQDRDSRPHGFRRGTVVRQAGERVVRLRCTTLRTGLGFRR